ncbi:serine-rich adhesin for platelets-like [Mytilus edulis]|uniref:serine-rich adhesin for platelets-like n=1 Tax=Mytilus edulis TaxID=6550 RepID=UPI0039F141F9
MCYLSPLACFVIAFLVNISTAQKTLESIHNELHITNFISCKPISIRLLIDTYRPSKVNLQAKLRLFIILLKMSLSFWIVFSTMVDQDVSTKPGPIMAIAKNHHRLYSKDEHEKNNPISKIATTSTCSSKPEQHCILSDVVQKQDEKEEEDKKVCYSRREFVTGEAKQCIKCSFLYDQFYRPSNHSYRSFQTFPAIPIRENEELNQEIPYFRLGNTRAVLDGNPAESGYAHNQTINLSNHRRRNLERIGSETNDGFNSLMASTPSSGFNSLTVYDPGALVTSNRRNDFQLMSTVSNRRPTISSSGYESGRGIRHVISGSFTFSLGLQVERDTNEEPNNQVNYPIQQDEPEHLSDLMPSISAGVSAELSCIESEHENPEGNEAVNYNIQISEICPSVDLFLPESPRPVLRTVRDHDLLACANQQENESQTLLATVVSLHNMTELKETESSGSSQSSMQASRNISLQAVSQTSVSPHYIPILDINLDLESSRQTGGENAIHLMIPVSTTDNQATGNTNESTEISASQTQSAIQPVSSSSGRINEHAHRNGNYYGSYNRLQNNQCVDDALFGDGQDTNTDKDTVDH